MIKVKCIATNKKLNIEKGKIYYFDEFNAHTIDNKAFYGNCYEYVENEGLYLLGLYPKKYFAIVK